MEKSPRQHSYNIPDQQPVFLLSKESGHTQRRKRKQAMQFKSSITFHYGDGNTANAKSVLSVLGACVKCGDEIELFCEGEDEEEALQFLVNSIRTGLGEEL